MARRQSVLSDNAETARAQILAAADSAVERFGVAKTTIDDVARETGVSRPTIYRYFRDRDTLITSLIETRARRLFEDAQAYVADRESFADQVVDGLLYLVDRGRRDPAIRLIVSPEHVDRGTALEGSSELAARLTFEMWAPLLETARERGEIRDGITDAEICKWITLVELILVGRMDFDDPVGEANRSLLTNLLLPGITTGAASIVS
ncbi:DNA-binding transcriptional regulator, AcrR family [Rhodococcus pyridinivorans]|uniref:TetR/AcrR family transcriptional regulator n=1 Tax=Rhodococcus pyridinivorans TaxID=103816 RepID=UPI0007CD7F63|nr:TetR/AcrR family transcriptional regulator [Rhodococcus pyridinivorans]SEC11985.1 DNA-binding transcriptional regulator, AcrR family [Rhodococcus pyridinivorans]